MAVQLPRERYRGAHPPCPPRERNGSEEGRSQIGTRRSYPPRLPVRAAAGSGWLTSRKNPPGYSGWALIFLRNLPAGAGLSGAMRILVSATILALGLCPAGHAQTSENNPRLKKALEQFPEADTDGDGVLTIIEAQAYVSKQAGGLEGLRKPKKKKEPTNQEGTTEPPSGKQQAGLPKPTSVDVAYGELDRQVLDFWKAESDAPTPVMIYFHGGGFRKGDKRQITRDIRVDEYLKNGISCISANYPFIDQMGVPGICKESEKVVDLVLKMAEEWNIDPKRIGVSGCSAGSLVSYWIGIHRSKDISVVGATMQALGTETLVPKITRDLPPSIIFQPHADGNALHDPVNAKMIQEACEKKGVECIVFGTGSNSFDTAPDGKDKFTFMTEFYRKHWGMN